MIKLPLLKTVIALMAIFAATATTAGANAFSPGKEFRLDEFAVPSDLIAGPDDAMYAPDGSLSQVWRVSQRGKDSFPLRGRQPGGRRGRP